MAATSLRWTCWQMDRRNRVPEGEKRHDRPHWPADIRNCKDSFPGAVFSAIGTGVPCCCWPYFGLGLLQLFNLDYVDGEVFCEPDGTGDSKTLMTRMRDKVLEAEPEDLVAGAGEEHFVTLNEKQEISFKAGFLNRFLRADGLDLANAGLKVTTDCMWSHSIENERVTRRIVSHHQLREFFTSPDLNLDFEQPMGVITAIYFKGNKCACRHI